MTQEDDKEQQPEVTNLKAIRLALGMTQEQFSVALDSSLSTIRRCEQGYSEMRFTLAQWRILANLMYYRLGIELRVWESGSLSDAAPAKAKKMLSKG